MIFVFIKWLSVELNMYITPIPHNPHSTKQKRSYKVTVIFKFTDTQNTFLVFGFVSIYAEVNINKSIVLSL